MTEMAEFKVDLVWYCSGQWLFQLTYPSLHILGKSIFIANNIYDATVDHNSSEILAFKTVILRYYMVHHSLKPMLKWEEKVDFFCTQEKQ